MIIRKRIFQFLTIVLAVTLINFTQIEISNSASNNIVIDQNLKPGMALKDAIQLLGSPEKMDINNAGNVVILYNELGLSIDLKSDGNTIGVIHLQSSFKGSFETGLEMGADFQKIISLYKQPDLMTKDIIEYSDAGRIFKISEGKLIGADLYSGKSSLFQGISKRVTVKSERFADEARVEVPEEVRQEIREEVRKEVIEELREEAREEAREDVREEVREEVIARGRDIVLEDGMVFDLFGFKVKMSHDGVIVTEIRSGSVAQNAGLKEGERIRRAFLKGYAKRNIYSVGGLEDILRKSIFKGNKTINILQNGNRYYKVEVPEVN